MPDIAKIDQSHIIKGFFFKRFLEAGCSPTQLIALYKRNAQAVDQIHIARCQFKPSAVLPNRRTIIALLKITITADIQTEMIKRYHAARAKQTGVQQGLERISGDVFFCKIQAWPGGNAHGEISGCKPLLARVNYCVSRELECDLICCRQKDRAAILKQFYTNRLFLHGIADTLEPFDSVFSPILVRDQCQTELREPAPFFLQIFYNRWLGKNKRLRVVRSGIIQFTDTKRTSFFRNGQGLPEIVL